jgi:hypothetical protein
MTGGAGRPIAGRAGSGRGTRPQYPRVIEIGPFWDLGAPLPHLVSRPGLVQDLRKRGLVR